jgi:hypothetical protein
MGGKPTFLVLAHQASILEDIGVQIRNETALR